MGIRERREREKREQRRRILDAAQEIIAQEGFAALTMRKLADRVEYSVGAIYLHFESREQIARELAEAGFGRLLEWLAAAPRGKDAAEHLHAIGQAYVAFGLRHHETYRLIFMGDSDYMTAAFAREEREQEGAARGAYRLLVEVAEGLQRSDPRLARVPANMVADMIWAALHGIVSLKLTCAGFQNFPAEAIAALTTEAIGRRAADPPRPAADRPTVA